jgi:hypothetical protein
MTNEQMKNGFDLMRVGYPGWRKLLDRAQSAIEKHNAVLGQIKEKFGGLRIYLDSYDEELDDVIGKIEAESCETCDLCGAAGRIVAPAGRWLVARCLKCAAEQKATSERLEV